MVEGLSDGELVAAALEGSQEAFGELVARYRDAVFGAAFHRLGRFEEARDAAQETFVKAYLHLGDLRKRESFANWLYHIADGTALDFARRPRREVALESVAEGALTDNTNGEHTEQSDLVLQVRDALSKLGESTRLAVILHYINGYSHAEVANFLGTTTGAVKTRICRAKSKLREEIEPMKQGLKMAEERFNRVKSNLIESMKKQVPNKAKKLFYFKIIHPACGVISGTTRAESRAELLASSWLRPDCKIIKLRLATKIEQEKEKEQKAAYEANKEKTAAAVMHRFLGAVKKSLFSFGADSLKITYQTSYQHTEISYIEISYLVKAKWYKVILLPSYIWGYICSTLADMSGIEVQFPPLGNKKQIGRMSYEYEGKTYEFKVELRPKTIRIDRIKLPRR
jgi:RNA polymerase sigma-70 factor (ECF subfamily)